jgi:hypothetical protein
VVCIDHSAFLRHSMGHFQSFSMGSSNRSRIVSLPRSRGTSLGNGTYCALQLRSRSHEGVGTYRQRACETRGILLVKAPLSRRIASPINRPALERSAMLGELQWATSAAMSRRLR